MRSSICDKGFFSVYYDDPAAEDLVESVDCGLSKGSNMAIAATVLYFVCQCMIPAAIPPSPVGLAPQQEQADQQPQQDPEPQQEE